MSWLNAAKQVVERKSYCNINPNTNEIVDDDDNGDVVLDMTTANMLVTVHKHLGDKYKDKFVNCLLLKQ